MFACAFALQNRTTRYSILVLTNWLREPAGESFAKDVVSRRMAMLFRKNIEQSQNFKVHIYIYIYPDGFT